MASVITNVGFHKHALEVLKAQSPELGQYYAVALRMAEVVRYDPLTTYMGTTIEKYDRETFESEYNTSYIPEKPQVTVFAWYLDIAGVEYMLEKRVPLGSYSEKYHLETDTWAVRFKLKLGQSGTYRTRYMDQTQYLVSFDFSGDTEDFETHATMFVLVSAEMAPVIGKEF
jgi:hypothetical protein